jgi:O-antigen ligase
MYVQFYSLYLLALNCVTTINQFDRIIRLFFIVLIIQSIIYYVQVYTGSSFSLAGHITEQGETPRPGGTVGTNSAIFAGFIMPILLIAIAHLMSHEKPSWARMYLLFTVLLGSISLILTIRRSAYAGAFLGLIWIAVVGYRKNIIKPRIFIATATIIGIILLSLPVILTVVESSRTDNRLSSAFNERFGLMLIAINVIENNPIAGVGPGAYPLEFKKYVTPELSDQWIFTVHNAYLLMTAEIGVVGGFALILFLLIGIRLCLRVSNAADPTLRATGLGLSGGIIAVSFEMYWEPFSVFFSPNALLWFLLGLMGAAETLSSSIPTSDGHIDKHHEENTYSQRQDGARDRPS